MRDIAGSEFAYQLWVDALCINHADTFDRNQHVLRRKVIFGHAFRILPCVHGKEELTDYELGYTCTESPSTNTDYCEWLMMNFGRQVLEEALGVRHRNWGAVEQQDEEIRDGISEDVFALMFDEHLGVPWRKDRKRNSGDEDWYESEPCNVRFLDVVQSELLTLLQKEYWSRLDIIQELTENPDHTLLLWGNWGGMPIPFPVCLALGDILLKLHEHEEPADPELWKKLKPKLDLWAFIAKRKELETATGGAERLDNVGIRELNSLVSRASCTFPQDRVYAILGFFPPSVSGAVTVDYNQDAAVTMARFRSVVPDWKCNRLEPRSDSDDE